MATDNAPAAPDPNARIDEIQQNSIRETSRNDGQLTDGTLSKTEHDQYTRITGERLPSPVDMNLQRKEIKPPSVVDKSIYHPPMSLDPANVTALDGWNDDTASCLKPVTDLLESTHGLLTELGKFRIAAHANGEWAEGQAILKIADAADRAFTKFAPRWDSVHATLIKQIAHYEKTLETPVKASADRPGISQELRNHFKSLTAADRMKQLHTAFDRGEHDVLAAVLGAPYQLSGLTPDMHALLTQKLNSAMNPEVANRLKATKAALALVENRTLIVHQEMERVVGVKRAKLAQLRASKSASDQALALIDHRINPLN